MKNTFGKIGFGLAGAIACAGLMSAGVQTAQAEITLLIPPSPVITNDATSGLYDWTYSLTLGGASPASSGSYFDFALPADSGISDYEYNLTGGNSEWTITQNISGYWSQAKYIGNTSIAAGSSLGSFTIVTTDGFHGTYSTPTSFTVSSNAGDPSTFIINAVTNGSGTDFGSLINPTTSTADYSTQGVVVPSISGNIPESPLPLPAAVWPALMTLAGMAVVGGMRLRRKAV